MGTIPRPRIVSRSTELDADDLPDRVTITVRELAGTVKEGLLALSVGVGLAVVHELFEAEVTRLAGPKGKHDPDRRAYRHGQESRQVTLGGRRVQVGVDIFNVMNSNVPQGYLQTFGPTWLRPTSVMDARFARVSGQIDF